MAKIKQYQIIANWNIEKEQLKRNIAIVSAYKEVTSGNFHIWKFNQKHSSANLLSEVDNIKIDSLRRRYLQFAKYGLDLSIEEDNELYAIKNKLQTSLKIFATQTEGPSNKLYDDYWKELINRGRIDWLEVMKYSIIDKCKTDIERLGLIYYLYKKIGSFKIGEKYINRNHEIKRRILFEDFCKSYFGKGRYTQASKTVQLEEMLDKSEKKYNDLNIEYLNSEYKNLPKK